MRWYTLRMNEDRIPDKGLNVKIEGRHPRVRLRSRWEQQVKKDVTQVKGRLWEQIKE
jgi:hypothetical protein